MAPDLLKRVRTICLALPEATERPSHGSPAFFVGKQFVMLWHRGHHEHDLPHLWCAAPPGAQHALVGARPDRFFVPPYVGHRGWLGVRLDGAVDWGEIEDLCEDAYRCVAPKRLMAQLDRRLRDRRRAPDRRHAPGTAVVRRGRQLGAGDDSWAPGTTAGRPARGLSCARPANRSRGR